MTSTTSTSSMNKILDLSHHDVVLGTGLRARHAISGHTFELIEYWYYLKVQHGVDAVIMCTAHKPDVLLKIARERYTFTDDELKLLESCVVDGTEALLARLPVALWVDGCSHYEPCAAAVAKRNVALACNNQEDFGRMDLVLGDTRIYDGVDHYVKKLLFSRFKPVTPHPENDDVAMLYCTIQARKLPQGYLNALPRRFNFRKFLLVTNDDLPSEGKFEVQAPPCHDLFERFGTYIYSPLKISWSGAIAGVGDCSPRFPAECMFYNKRIIIDAPMSRGLAVRMHDLRDLSAITLTKDDPLVKFL